MTPRLLALNQKNSEAIRRRKFSNIGLFKRNRVGMKNNLIRGGRAPQLSIAAAPVSSWICTSTSWSNMQTVEPWTVEEDNWDEIEEGMKLFAEWTTVDDDEEVMVEPETHDSLLMAALLSTKELLPSPSAGLLRALSCPDLLMNSLAAILFETRHCHYIVLSTPLPFVPPSPQWMFPLEAPREMDPPNSLVSTVSLPSGWDAVSARQSSSSIFNLFSDLSLSSIHRSGTGIRSAASTVSVPTSFWDTPSTVSVTKFLWDTPSTVSVPSFFWDLPAPALTPEARPITSSTSSLFPDPSEVSSSMSTLFMDPSSVRSSDSSLLFTGSSSLSSTCPHCLRALDPDWPVYGYAGSSEEYYDESSLRSSDSSDEESGEDAISAASSFTQFVARRCAAVDESETDTSVSVASSGYETDVDSVPMDIATTVSATTQTADNKTSTTRALADCDKMLEKLMELKKKLREMMDEGKDE